MLLGGLDISGNPNEGNYKFMGIVLGTKQGIDLIVKQLNLEQYSASQIKHVKTRKDLSTQLCFDCKETVALCVRIEQDRIIDKIKTMWSKRDSRSSLRKVYSTFNYIVLNEIRDEIIKFTNSHSCDLFDVAFHCDEDCKYFSKQHGLRYKICDQRNPTADKNEYNNLYSDEEYVYVLSDIVAWANNRGIEPEGVLSINLADILEIKMKNAFR